MSWLTNLFSGTAGGIVDSIANVADRFIQTDEEKNEFKLKVMNLVQQRDTEIESTARTELETKSKIIAAEMAQDDNYTKRARPTVVYFGLIVIAFNYCLVPVVALILSKNIPLLELPGEFWAAWGGIVSLWTIGRSAEKRGVDNRLTKMAEKLKIM